MKKKKNKEITGRTAPISFVVQGEPASKANSRRLITTGGRPRSIKSQKALDYVTAFQWQCPRLDPMFECEVEVTIKIYYASNRPDLDESVILDAMQGFIYANDRQARRKIIDHAIDRENPRAEIHVQPRQSKD